MYLGQDLEFSCEQLPPMGIAEHCISLGVLCAPFQQESFQQERSAARGEYRTEQGIEKTDKSIARLGCDLSNCFF